MKIEAQGNHVIVKPRKFESTTESGIVIADVSNTKKARRGFVVSVGMGKPGEDPPEVRVGQTVIYPHGVGYPLVHNSEELLVLQGDDILAREVELP